ncbi:class I SAM-dependent methyltransferase [Phytohabitans rumicis]|uniref:class I SAM-dependent methyltransferase n=1 Tax=Phytohabitans rumicis TaxID=1076125 RepID=UPI0015677E3D|nr:class I SAM-dependent methyltransferase [Phytohabitans rumicis]
MRTSPDRERWPDVATVPRAPLRAAAVAGLVRWVARRLPLRVVTDGGGTQGPDRPGVPVLRLHRPEAFHRRLGARGLIGFGEAYQAGDWDTDDLAGLLTAFAGGLLDGRLGPLRQLGRLRHVAALRPLYGARIPPAEEDTVDGARRNIQHHYDLSNDLFALFLDETMTYSSALFDPDPRGATAADLGDAQRRKIDRLLDRTEVGAGTRVLEVGTGWGELAIRAARRGALVHTVTISAAQRDLAVRRAAAAGVADRVTVDLRDYRHVEAEPFDAVLSVEMIEAVGERYWPTYFATLDRLLAPGGRVGLQAITVPHERLRASRTGSPPATWTCSSSSSTARPLPGACINVDDRAAADPDDDRRRRSKGRIQHRYATFRPPCRIAAWASPRSGPHFDTGPRATRRRPSTTGRSTARRRSRCRAPAPGRRRRPPRSRSARPA